MEQLTEAIGTAGGWIWNVVFVLLVGTGPVSYTHLRAHET